MKCRSRPPYQRSKPLVMPRKYRDQIFPSVMGGTGRCDLWIPLIRKPRMSGAPSNLRETDCLMASAVQAIKQSVSRRLIGDREHFWQARYYDFNVWTKRKRVEKLCYIHRNPVKRGLVEKPEDWPWSSFRHHLTGEESVVEIESLWTGRKRERMGTVPRVKIIEPTTWGS